MSKLPFTVPPTPSSVKLKFDDGVKSVQIRNLDFVNFLWVSDNPNGLLSTDDRWEIPPRTDAVFEVDPAKKVAIFYACNSNRDTNNSLIECTPFYFYGVRGILQGDMNPTRPICDYTEYTAANDNENIAYNIATAFIGTLNGHRVRDIMIKAQTNDVLIGLDNQVALARGPPVVALAHLEEGEVWTVSDHSHFLEITAMNAAIGQNCEIWIWVAGD